MCKFLKIPGHLWRYTNDGHDMSINPRVISTICKNTDKDELAYKICVTELDGNTDYYDLKICPETTQLLEEAGVW